MRKGGSLHCRGPFQGAASVSLVAALAAAAMPLGAALAQQSTGGAQQAPVQQAPSAGTGTNAVSLPEIKVIGTTPLAPSRPVARPAAAAATAAPAAVPETAPKPVPGAVEQDKIPSNVQTVGASAFDYAKAPDLLQAMVQALPGVALSSQTGNEFQLDFNYRGYVAGPVIGTPQGLAVYQNGVRINEVFGDVVNWDLIPQSAINRLTLVPSNPVYGLNAIGGALAFEMKNGYTYHAVEGEVNGGSYGRAVASVQAGGEIGNLSGYITADAIDDAGWRNESPSSLRRVFADLGARGDQTEFHVTFTGANNNFSAHRRHSRANAQRRIGRAHTLMPQTTQNQLAFLTASATWKPSDTWTYQAIAYFRNFRQTHVDGNGTNAQNDRGVPGSHHSVLSQPGRHRVQPHHDQGPNNPSKPAHSVHKLLGRTRPNLDNDQQFRRLSAGVIGGKSVWSREQFHDRAERRPRACAIFHNQRVGNGQCQSIPDRAGFRSLHQPALGRRRASRIGRDDALYRPLRDRHLDVTSRLSVTAGGRYNFAQINLTDELGNNALLNGNHPYTHFNPMIGATYKVTPNLTFYGDFAEANRAPTPLELACSDPVRPCLIDNALVGDPNLQQVVSYTFEGGLRGQFDIAKGLLNWTVGGFHALNTNDILPISSPLIGHQFFQNAGNTLRQGIEANVTYKQDRWNVYANYTYVDATFQNALTLQSPFNPFADANGNIFVVPGDHIPGIPDFRFKLGGEYQITNPWKFGADLNVIGSQWLVGDQSNQNPKLPAYWVVNLHSSYKVTENVEVFGLVRNLFNQHYAVFGTFFDVNSYPYLNLTDPRTFVPGMPFAAYVGVRGTIPHNRTGIRSRCLAAAGYKNVAHRLDRGCIVCC